MHRPSIITPLLLLVTLVSGCAKYNYEIVQPEASRLRIGDEWQRLEAGPVAYRFRTLDNHLVVLVYNVTGDPLRILGDRSYIVTPAKQTIPVATQPIAPGAYVKLILPPVEQIVRPGPVWTFGLGGSLGDADPNTPVPAYRVVDSTTPYWEWDGESDVTLHLVFEQRDKTFDQTFVLHRVKV